MNYDTDNTAYVYVKDAKGEKERRNVILGLSDTSMVQVTEGLSEGETVFQEVKMNMNMMYGYDMDMGQPQGGGPGAPEGEPQN